MTVQIKVTNGEHETWYDVDYYNDFDEVLEDFISSNRLAKDYDEDGYDEDDLNATIWISDICNEFEDDYPDLAEYYTDSLSEDKEDQGCIEDEAWANLKNDIEILQKFEDDDKLWPLISYYRDSSCGDLESASRQFPDAYCGEYQDGAQFAEFETEEMYGETPSHLACNINWEGVWQDLTMDYWITDGHVFRSI